MPLAKPEVGRYHLVRFIRSDRWVDAFRERFRPPPEAEREYIVATVDVERQRLCVTLGDDRIEEFRVDSAERGSRR